MFYFSVAHLCLGAVLFQEERRSGDRGAPGYQRGTPATFRSRSGSCRPGRGCDTTRWGPGRRSAPSRWQRCLAGWCKKPPSPGPWPPRRTEAGWWRRRSAGTPGSGCTRAPSRRPAAPRQSGSTRGCSAATHRASGGKAAPGSWGWRHGWWAHKPERCPPRRCGEILPHRKGVRGWLSLYPDTYPLLEAAHPCW